MSPNPRRPRPKLDRRNASNNIDYDAPSSATAAGDDADSPSTLRATRSLDLYRTFTNQTSFRVGGSTNGEIDLICRSLGLSGPEEFGISADAWEESRARRSSSDLLPRSRLSPAGMKDSSELCNNSTARVSENVGIRGLRPPVLAPPESTVMTWSAPPTMSKSGMNPSPLSVLAPPPSISLPKEKKIESVWDLVKSFAPNDVEEANKRFFEDEEEEENKRFSGDENEEEEAEVRLREEASTSEDIATSTSNDDNSPGMTREVMLVVSPNGRFRRNIRSWMKGQQLGSGSFGTVFEGISDNGFFFAVKEVSLLDQGANAQQCILQLEQEIALLSQFEHENIVQYYGTDKEEAKLFIFIELVTQGSLASLYQKYRLQDSQVSAYTRQILNGLNYLHERNVVHRDIKCANILVHANGSVKLADFGLAKQITKINVLKSCKGSVYWMAPEVVKPVKPYGPAADIWSLGCTVLEMLTQQVPYPNMEWIHVLFKVGKGEKPPIPGNLSIDARDFITRCVQANPANRPTARELLEHPFVKRPLSSYSYSSSPGIDR